MNHVIDLPSSPSRLETSPATASSVAAGTQPHCCSPAPQASYRSHVAASAQGSRIYTVYRVLKPLLLTCSSKRRGRTH